MTFRKPFLLVAPMLMIACGQAGQGPMEADADGPGYNALAERVAALTGRPVAEGGQAMEAGAEAYAGGQGGGRQTATGFRTVPIRINGFSMPTGQKQVPAHWQELPNDAGYTGPGVSVKNIKGGNFTYVTGQMAQFYQQSGVTLRAPVAPEQLVQGDSRVALLMAWMCFQGAATS